MVGEQIVTLADDRSQQSLYTEPADINHLASAFQGRNQLLPIVQDDLFSGYLLSHASKPPYSEICYINQPD